MQYDRRRSFILCIFGTKAHRERRKYVISKIKTMIQLNPHKDIYAIPVPLEATNLLLRIPRYNPEGCGLYYTKDNEEVRRCFLPPGNWQILGEVTKGMCTKKIVEELGIRFGLKGLKELLAANGMYFENPMGDKPVYIFDLYIDYPQYSKDLKHWQSYQDKLVEKALIIQKVEK